ncbi:glycosyltransferase family 4 protein [Brucella sp. 21LCYQ03]|nr:glycosyltransferase family 4 protein [Brucella sp. 21LCYQ03]
MILLLVSFFASAILSSALLYVISALLPRSFLAAGFNARSNHSVAAQQIGGLALVPSALIVVLLFGPDMGITVELVAYLSGASLLLWAIGLLDDGFELSVYLRFGSQLLASCMVIYGLGPDFRILPDLLPHWLEAILILITLVAAINITNFMDGLDLMTVAGLGVPLTGIAILTMLQLSGVESGSIAAILAGALLGFSFFNRPPARIFLGDSGSLPLGLMTGTALLLLARETHIVVALVLPLYYVLDAGTTIILRLVDRENILKAHSKHAYQVAKRSGWSVLKVVAHVAFLNVVLILCAIAMLHFDHLPGQIAFVLIAIVAVLMLLLDFRGRFRKL